LDEEEQQDGTAWAVYAIDKTSGMADVYQPVVGKSPEECTNVKIRLDQITRTGGKISDFDEPRV